MSKPFTASQFTPTKFATAEDKAKFANKLVTFVERGFLETQFTQDLYRRLSNCFGHIAHHNRNGFYGAWFDTPSARRDWVANAVDWGCYGEPEYTFCDVERAVIDWLQHGN